ncbi:MFS transporter [Falsiroseomonas stagni]|uniref:Cyanate permease n=1 Tax=Falsiroseomonas stagni DSM 19981 TaxID=1123062 RepID=A0A1I4C1U7_9PROT|nr:MFS transporter [Falsiroseomonas stagni]SFK74905.1 Cyanate permease [Falsiroseomonas stagni DSM 19981]
MTTRWPPILAILAGGILGAAQIGKVPAAMTTIGAEFGLGLAGAALLVSLFALMAALGGLAIGLAAARIGPNRALLAGLGIGTMAAGAAALAPGPAALLAARVAEGAGFLLLTVAAPGLIAGLATARDRATAMAIWGAYMPLGVALGLASAPLVAAFGWRVAWGALAALLALAGIACWRMVPRAPVAPTGAFQPMGQQVRALVAARRPLQVASAFATYNIMYLGIAAFLPARLESLGAGTGMAGVAAAVAALANAGGNLASGVLMARGVAAERLVVAGAVAMSVTAAGVYLVPSAIAATALAVLACGVGGLVPASCFAILPRAVPAPALVAPAVGLVMQGNNLAQLLAPPAIGALATIAWPLAALPLLAAGLLAALAGRALTR